MEKPVNLVDEISIRAKQSINVKDSFADRNTSRKLG